MKKSNFFMVAAFVLASIVLFICAMQGCAGLTPQDKTELSTYAAEQDACILEFKGNMLATDECRAAVKRNWCVQWASRLDGGVCPQ